MLNIFFGGATRQPCLHGGKPAWPWPYTHALDVHPSLQYTTTPTQHHTTSISTHTHTSIQHTLQHDIHMEHIALRLAEAWAARGPHNSKTHRNGDPHPKMRCMLRRAALHYVVHDVTSIGTLPVCGS